MAGIATCPARKTPGLHGCEIIANFAGMKRGLKPDSEDGQEVEAIEHDGLVIRSGSGVVEVRLTDDGNCGACPAAKLCGVAGKTAQVVRITTSDYADYKPGERVIVDGSETLHRKAIRLATVYPTLAVLAVMVAVYLLTASQMAAALSGVAVVVAACAALYAARHRLAAEFVFTIRKAET